MAEVIALVEEEQNGAQTPEFGNAQELNHRDEILSGLEKENLAGNESNLEKNGIKQTFESTRALELVTKEFGEADWQIESEPTTEFREKFDEATGDIKYFDIKEQKENSARDFAKTNGSLKKFDEMIGELRTEGISISGEKKDGNFRATVTIRNADGTISRFFLAKKIEQQKFAFNSLEEVAQAKAQKAEGWSVGSIQSNYLKLSLKMNEGKGTGGEDAKVWDSLRGQGWAEVLEQDSETGAEVQKLYFADREGNISLQTNLLTKEVEIEDSDSDPSPEVLMDAEDEGEYISRLPPIESFGISLADEIPVREPGVLAEQAVDLAVSKVPAQNETPNLSSAKTLGEPVRAQKTIESASSLTLAQVFQERLDLIPNVGPERLDLDVDLDDVIETAPLSGISLETDTGKVDFVRPDEPVATVIEGQKDMQVQEEEKIRQPVSILAGAPKVLETAGIDTAKATEITAKLASAEVQVIDRNDSMSALDKIAEPSASAIEIVISDDAESQGQETIKTDVTESLSADQALAELMEKIPSLPEQTQILSQAGTRPVEAARGIELLEQKPEADNRQAEEVLALKQEPAILSQARIIASRFFRNLKQPDQDSIEVTQKNGNIPETAKGAAPARAIETSGIMLMDSAFDRLALDEEGTIDAAENISHQNDKTAEAGAKNRESALKLSGISLMGESESERVVIKHAAPVKTLDSQPIAIYREDRADELKREDSKVMAIKEPQKIIRAPIPIKAAIKPTAPELPKRTVRNPEAKLVAGAKKEQIRPLDRLPIIKPTLKTISVPLGKVAVPKISGKAEQQSIKANTDQLSSVAQQKQQGVRQETTAHDPIISNVTSSPRQTGNKTQIKPQGITEQTRITNFNPNGIIVDQTDIENIYQRNLELIAA